MMRVEYDKEVDAAYIYLKYPLKNNECKKTKEINKNIILDYNGKGKVIGVEILNASKILDKKTIKESISE